MTKVFPALRALLPLTLLLVIGCESTSAPERRELLGSWVSQNLPDATVSMTLAESGRSIDGAGLWVEGEDVQAFRVSGAIARDEVALHLDFEARDDLVFQGYFAAADSLEGVLAGGAIHQMPVIFVREDLLP